MKTVLFFLLAILPFRGEIAAAASSNKLLSYQENYPESPHWYEFSIESYCKDAVDPISIKDFVSNKVYSNKQVRIVHIYVTANNKNCKEPLQESRSLKFTIPTDTKRMTHTYVTYDSDITLKSGH